MSRLIFFAALASLYATPLLAQAPAPIIFVHGNGDDATKWIPIIWLFESNGYPSDRLFSIRFTDPSARTANSRPEAFHSSTTDEASELSAIVTRVLLETKASKVMLVGSSRGGMTIRNYLKNAGGSAVVSHAVLCGTPNHGVMLSDTNLDNEFNGKGPFLRQLNGGSELVEGVKFLTLRSDRLDKYAQPNVGYDGPELKGAENVVLPNLDHRELAFHPLAFARMYLFLTGQTPTNLRPVPQELATIGGIVSGFAGTLPTNQPLAGVRMRVYKLQADSADRDGDAILDIKTGPTGAWGPLQVRPDSEYEFVLENEARSVTYFMSGLARSTTLLNFRFLPARAMEALGGKTDSPPNLLIHRPQGYLSKGRDPVTVDGVSVPEIIPGIPARDSVGVHIPAAKKAGVRVGLRGEMVHARPAQTENEVNVVELIWD